MEMQRRVSLRYKLVALLAILPIVFLAVYLAMATNLFYQDKKAYVYDSSVFMARSLSSQIKMDLSSFKRAAKPIIDSIDKTNFQFSPRSVSFFKAQKNIEHFIIYKKKTEGKTFIQ